MKIREYSLIARRIGVGILIGEMTETIDLRRDLSIQNQKVVLVSGPCNDIYVNRSLSIKLKRREGEALTVYEKRSIRHNRGTWRIKAEVHVDCNSLLDFSHCCLDCARRDMVQGA